MQDLMLNTDGIKAILAKQIQEEGLRTYLFTSAHSTARWRLVPEHHV